MPDDALSLFRFRTNVAPWRIALARWVESAVVQRIVIGVIIFNAIILGLETDAGMMERYGPLLKAADLLCLAVFCLELGLKFAAYRLWFWRSGWNVFDFLVVAVALLPGAGPWAVLRSLRVLRVLRLLTAIPSLRRVVAAFLHSIPGLGGVVAVMSIFFYTAAVLATRLFVPCFDEWFGSIGSSLYSLFQIMSGRSWPASSGSRKTCSSCGIIWTNTSVWAAAKPRPQNDAGSQPCCIGSLSRLTDQIR
jgi:voltage-gated sodium channel